MLYDVQVMVDHHGHYRTDTVTGDRTYARDRRDTLNARGETSNVIDRHGRIMRER